MSTKNTPEFNEAGFGLLVLLVTVVLALTGVGTWSWWFLLIPLVTSTLGSLGVLRVELLLTPFGSTCTSVNSDEIIRSYLSYYVFGIRIISLHLNR